MTVLEMRDDLISKGFVTLNYPDALKTPVSNLMNSWRSFCSLQLNEKKLFTYEDGVGYEYKDAKDPRHDNIENIHVSMGGLQRLLNISLNRKNTTYTFLAKAESVLTVLAKIVEEYSSALREGFPDSTDIHTTLSYRDWVIRCLHYPNGGRMHDVIAAPHPDKSLSLYLGETCPGVEYYNPDFGHISQWLPLPTGPNNLILAAGMQMQLATESQVKAMYHRVIATKKTVMSGRYAIVCCIPLHNVPKFNKDIVGRLQDMRVGFNYDMSHDVFKKLFEQRTFVRK